MASLLKLLILASLFPLNQIPSFIHIREIEFRFPAVSIWFLFVSVAYTITVVFTRTL
ncbi:hypothetical protein IC582_024276 [Cucumis melo]